MNKQQIALMLKIEVYYILFKNLLASDSFGQLLFPKN